MYRHAQLHCRVARIDCISIFATQPRNGMARRAYVTYDEPSLSVRISGLPSSIATVYNLLVG